MRFSMPCACLMIFAALATAKADNQANAVQDAARGYRIQIYETFRSDRTQYDQRRAVGDGLLNHWDQAGRPAAWSDELVVWFEQARDGSRTSSSELPALPDLLPVIEEQSAPEVTTQAPAATPTDSQPPSVNDTSTESASSSQFVEPAPAAPQETSAEAAATTTLSTEPASTEPASSAPSSSDALTTDTSSSETLSSAKEENKSGALKALGGAIWRTLAE